jgi:F-type H+-transporting ATPase subunit a
VTIPVLGGFTFPPIDELFRWKAFFLSGTPFAMNKTVLLILVSVTVLSTLFVVATRNMQFVPGKLQNVAEMGWEFVDQGIVRDVIGPDSAGWSSFMATLFFFILFLNVWEVIPIMQFPPTSRMAVPLYLAIQSYIIMIVVGIAVQGPWQYFKGSIVPPGVPKVMLVLVVPIEFISKFMVRPFSLSVRLLANMMAGHILLTAVALLCAACWTTSIPEAPLLPFLVALNVAVILFEVLVVVLQAYIFTILTAVYIAESKHPEH